MSDPKKPETDEPVDRARRRLLARAVYVPPVVIGIISLQQAGCQPGPSGCTPSTPCNPTINPCQPGVNPCSPNTGCNPDNCNPNN
jgi:hypothetical protein